MSIPSNDPKKQRAHYSGKKKRHTLKSQILIHQPSGRFLSLRVAKGKVHDFRLWKETKIRLHPQVNLLADSGYEGIQKLKTQVEKPLKRTKKNPLKAEEKRKNRELSGRRIKVEHAIRRLKFFRLLSERYRNRRKRFGLRINLIAAIMNFEL